MFEGFTRRRIATSGAEINLLTGGAGPPLLLLHGFPQTHVIWHKIADRLAERFTVVATDLRGYGDSEKPASDPEHRAYSKRVMAQDQVEIMRALGFERFAVAGHDRGGRVGHRLALDHPSRVTAVAVLDIVPTLTLFESANQEIATGYYHWYFLIQPDNFPEHMIGQDPDFYLQRKIRAWGAGRATFSEEALGEYLRCFRDPAAIHAMCEDYRAAASIDLVHDREDRAAGRKLACPTLALWGERAMMHRWFDVLETWRGVCEAEVSGRALDCGHYLAEEAPEETLAELTAFFGR